MNIVLITSRIDAGIRFFLYVLIFWLPYSPAVIEVSVVAGLFLWILKHCFIFFHQLKQEKDLKCFYPPSSILNKPISFFIIICIISIMSSAFFEQALHGFISKTLEWFIIYFLIIETFKDKKCVYIAVGIFLFTAVSTVLDGLIQCYWTHKDIFSGHILDPDGRVNASFRTPNGLGGYLTIVVGILLGSFFTMKNGFWRIGFGILIGLTLWVEFLTYSRGSWI
ncbi:MAG: hypothetical protein KC733_00205, partial [Candidatus Omnitrophica bacterium]|nr:hypothetical protein [Candidatus Omnitrophota bacterium]